jgi:hypothetical protein
MKKALVFLPFLVALLALSAVAADDTLVKFRGGNGVPCRCRVLKSEPSFW